LSKTYLVEELFSDIPGDPEHQLFTFPPELIGELGWKEGDLVTFIAEDGKITIKKVSEDAEPKTTKD